MSDDSHCKVFIGSERQSLSVTGRTLRSVSGESGGPEPAAGARCSGAGAGIWNWCDGQEGAGGEVMLQIEGAQGMTAGHC